MFKTQIWMCIKYIYINILRKCIKELNSRKVNFDNLYFIVIDTVIQNTFIVKKINMKK